MKYIFEQGEFDGYRSYSLDAACAPIMEQYQIQYEPTVFISHKHNDLNDLKGILGLLEQQFGVKVYIDSRDPSMPPIISGETALRIKQRIDKCKKFIFLATNGAIESKWCNWELGYGDARKSEHKNIALFPMKPKDGLDYQYKGTEYFSIYPHIVYSDGTECYDTRRPIEIGYYVRTVKDGKGYLQKLYNWLHD